MSLINLEELEAVTEILKEAGLPVPVLHTFAVDYRDKQNNYFNETHQMIGFNNMNITNELITGEIIKHYEPLGFVVYSIYEILNGLPLQELRQINITSANVLAFIRPIYYDKSREVG
jgi:hypothetical protein